MKISTSSTIALDSMVFIYFLESTLPQFHVPSTNLIQFLQTNPVSSLTSIISVVETLSSPTLKLAPEKTEAYLKFFQNFPRLTVHSVDWSIGWEAARLRKEYPPLKTPDSIQLATALVHNADVFITNDDRLKNLSLPNLKILPVSQL